MSVYAYVRVSTDDQTVENQRQTINDKYTVTTFFEDAGVSGVVKGLERTGLKAALDYIREGETLVVTAIDRLGRDTVDVVETVEAFQAKGVSVVSIREGFDLSSPTGKAMLTIIAALAGLERANMKERQMAGIKRAKADGKYIGRAKTIDDKAIVAWRAEQEASIKDTATHFGVSPASVKRAMKAVKEATGG